RRIVTARAGLPHTTTTGTLAAWHAAIKHRECKTVRLKLNLLLVASIGILFASASIASASTHNSKTQSHKTQGHKAHSHKDHEKHAKRSHETRVREARSHRGRSHEGRVASAKAGGGGASGIASIYSTDSGSSTASGQRLNPGALTAAHRSLPFGTKVR